MPIYKPLIILGAPRSGTTILKRALMIHSSLWHLPGESHYIFEGPLHPIRNGYDSNRIIGSSLSFSMVERFRTKFYNDAINISQVLPDSYLRLSGNSLYRRILNKAIISILGWVSKGRKPVQIRFIEKTPKNSLRIPLLEKIFPDALYIWNFRDPLGNIDSLVDGWKSVDRVGPLMRERFARAGYRIAKSLEIKGYHGTMWKFALVPGWQRMKTRTIPEISAFQYLQCNKYILNDLEKIDKERIFFVKHESFINNPILYISNIFRWASLPEESELDRFLSDMPVVNSTRSKSSDSGIRYHEQVIRAIKMTEGLHDLVRDIGDFRARRS